jgi:adenylate cyclase
MERRAYCLTARWLDPNGAWAWSRLGWLQNYVDQPKNAIRHFERALRLSPLDPLNFNNYVGMAAAHYVMQEHEQAVPLYQRAHVGGFSR